MSLIAIVNLAERLLDQSPSHDSLGQSGAKLAAVKDGEDATAATQDHFTPSAATHQDHATAQAAGLFRASQVTFFSAAADFLLAQTVPQTANPSAPAQALPTAAPAAQAVSAVPPREPLIPLGPVATTAASSPGAAAPTGAGSAGATNALAAATGSNSTASSLSQLQALNNALASLGLNAQQLPK